MRAFLSCAFGLLGGFLGLEPFRVTDDVEDDVRVAPRGVSLRFWEGFKCISFSREMTLTGKRFAIVVDDELLEFFGDADSRQQ